MGSIRVVKEKEVLSTGLHTFSFYMAPMVHWPEVLVTYDQHTGVLFSADAFGTFGALSGNLFADQVSFQQEWLPEARRYYANIVGKYGPQVQALLGKIAGLDIRMICPLHGPIWRKDIPWYLDKYQKWSTYTPEENAVVILYGSIYGNTENAAEILAGMLSDQGVENIALYDVSQTHVSQLVAEAFRASHLVLLSATHDMNLFHKMEAFLVEAKARNLQKRTLALVQNGSWAPGAEAPMRRLLGEMKDMQILEPALTIRSALQEEQREALQAMARAITTSLEARPGMEAPHLAEEPASVGRVTGATSASEPSDSSDIDPKALFTIGYGLYVLTSQADGKDSGCIVNTVMQLTDSPKRLCVAINKNNHTHRLVLQSGLINISVLTTGAPFALFQHFGFQSGQNVDKFAGRADPRSKNGLYYLAEYSDAFLSAKVYQAIDCGTHTLFLADITQAVTLANQEALTYAYYFAHIKPTPKPKQKPGFVCKICGYFYEGETLPPDFICPLCKHGASDFEFRPGEADRPVQKG